jgi:hypothetical protein
MEKMTRVNATKQYLQSGTNVTTKEFMDFWKACNEDERQSFAEQSARNLGAELQGKAEI